MNKLLIVSLIVFSAITFGSVEVLAQTQITPIQGNRLLDPAQTMLMPQPISIDPTAVPESNLGVGARGLQVKKIQETLKALGYLPADLEPSQYFGPLTREALRKFQSDNNLPATGFLGPATRKALRDKIQSEVRLGQRPADLACMRTAVEKRENALISAHTTYTDKVKAARETRKNDFLNAWTIQDPNARHRAINDAWVKFRTNSRLAHTEWLNSRRAAWVQFEKDRRACKAPATGENQSLEKVETTE